MSGGENLEIPSSWQSNAEEKDDEEQSKWRSVRKNRMPIPVKILPKGLHSNQGQEMLQSTKCIRYRYVDLILGTKLEKNWSFLLNVQCISMHWCYCSNPELSQSLLGQIMLLSAVRASESVQNAEQYFVQIV